MAMVLDAFASYVQHMLTEMVKEEAYMLLGVRDEIDKLDVKLRDLKNYLTDADRRNITDETVREWVAQLKRAMYEAADILDLCQLKAMENGPSTTDVGFFNPLLRCFDVRFFNSLLFFLRNPLHAHVTGSRIKALNKRLDTIKERSDPFRFINIGACMVDAPRAGNPSRETSGEFDRSGVVGEKINEDTRKLVEIVLTEKESDTNIMVVAIVGVGGIGKTTLAQKVFNDEMMNAKFDKKVWLSINQNFNKVELLRTIITLVGGVHGGAKALSVLLPILTTALTGKKLFLVLDDVWSHIVWSEVLETPLANVVARGTRVLVTTRDERVARGMKAVLPRHHVNKLEEDDGWSLLRKQIVSSEIDGREVDMLKDIGLQLIAKCDGLPLAIKVMGGLLCQKDKTRREWQMVLSISSVTEMPEVNYAVYLSYEDLPSCIKQCFLYYALLLKTALYSRSTIVGMWISEGFLHGTSDDLEELGSNYYKELILRNLIEPNDNYIDQSICNMHDVVRSFAQFVARDEALAAHSGETNIVRKLSEQKFLRLSIESKASVSDGLDWNSLRSQDTLRTLISAGHINMHYFPCLRTLHIDSAHANALVESLHKLKHLRYLSLEESDIASLPESIGNMKFLQHINLRGSKHFLNLPDSIVKLRQLRYLNFNTTSLNGIPRGFRVLTNLRIVHGFPARVDGDWCSLEELGPLSQLRQLGLDGLENVTSSSFAAKAKLCAKVHLTNLDLTCSSRLGYDGMIEEENVISEEEQQRSEEVFDELRPPPSLEHLSIKRYFGRRLPRWMMSSSPVTLKSLRILMVKDMAWCTQLPDGLCQLPYLEFIQIECASVIKRVAHEFLQFGHHKNPYPSQVEVAFPKLHVMKLLHMVEWEEWEWEEQVQAFPVLKELILVKCKLTRLPPGLAYQARALNVLSIQHVHGLISLENFASLVELEVIANLDLEKITNLPRLQKLTITHCPKLKVLGGVPALQRLLLEADYMDTLPEYIGCINPRHFELNCSLVLLGSITIGQSGSEWDKLSHIKHVKAYAREGDNRKKWYVLYTANPYNLETNVSRSFMSTGTLSYLEDIHKFESVFKMTRKTFSYICSLVSVRSLEDMNSYTFVDGRVLCLQDRVAVALRSLYSSDPLETLGSSVGVNKSTILLVTEKFVDAVNKRAGHHLCWPDSSKMDKIKSMFDKIHNMHNCCGVLCTSHIPFGKKYDNENNCINVMQAVVDPEMRFTSIALISATSMNRSSILHNSNLFQECKKGAWLNGSKLKIALDGSAIGEYLIGDAEYPLLPWLLTPYQEADLSDSKGEFNRRHSAATTCALNALARLKDTWKYLQGETVNPKNLYDTVFACCILHNIVIEMEDDAATPSSKWGNYCKDVRQLAKEDAVKARDMLSLYFLTSRPSEPGAGLMDAEEDREVAASGSRDKHKEQEAQRRTAEEGRYC